MRNLGPLLIVFGFFAVLFAVGKILQRKERKKRLADRAKAGHITVSRPVSVHFGRHPFESALRAQGQGQGQEAGQSERPNRLGYDA